VPPRSGEHEEHREYSCSRCHGTGYSSTAVNATNHMNGVVDMPVSFYNRTSLTCSSQSCHGSEDWERRGTVTANCSSCHGFPPVPPHPQRTGCHDCHTSMRADGTLTLTHNDGHVDLSGSGCATCHGYPPVSTRTGALHTTDENCYGCHSTTVDATNHVSPNGTHNDGAVQVGGGGVGTYGCQSCHGDQARPVPAGLDPHVKSAPPYGTRGETLEAQRAVGAHLAHLTRTAGLSKPLHFGECHPVPAAMDHANGSTVFAFGPLATAGGASPTFDGSSCASTYCHGGTLGAGGSNHAPLWTGGASQVACGTCHASPPPGPHPANPNCGGCHAGYTGTTVNAAVHVDGKLDVNAMTCGSCHAIPPPAPHTSSTACGGCHAGYTATTVVEATHINGTVDISAQACGACHAIPPPPPHTTNALCGQCHAGYTDATVNDATHGNGTVDTSLTCTSCHGKSGLPATAAAPLNAAPPADTLGAATGLRVGAHQKHLVGGTYANAYPCQTCHASVGTYGNGHTNGTNNVAFTGAANANLRKGTWTPRSGATAGSCSSTWCHGAVINRNGGTSGGLATRPSWTGTITTCTACHAVSMSSLPNRHTESDHRGYACSVCHGTGYSSTAVNKPTHVDGVKTIFIRSSGTGIRSWNPSTRTCTASCHGSEQW
jgi:predicted CxxxxCH...CXXCH cytochrome family protein